MIDNYSDILNILTFQKEWIESTNYQSTITNPIKDAKK
jgi:hypothetical protein